MVKHKTTKKQIVIDARFRVLMKNGRLVRDKKGEIVVIPEEGYGSAWKKPKGGKT